MARRIADADMAIWRMSISRDGIFLLAAM